MPKALSCMDALLQRRGRPNMTKPFRGLLGKAGLGLVFLIDLLSESGQLAALEVGEPEAKETHYQAQAYLL